MLSCRIVTLCVLLHFYFTASSFGYPRLWMFFSPEFCKNNLCFLPEYLQDFFSYCHSFGHLEFRFVFCIKLLFHVVPSLSALERLQLLQSMGWRVGVHTFKTILLHTCTVSNLSTQFYSTSILVLIPCCLNYCTIIISSGNLRNESIHFILQKF